jgi:hypothetical protein
MLFRRSHENSFGKLRESARAARLRRPRRALGSCGVSLSMNRQLAEAEFDAYLDFLHRALLAARLACYAGDTKQAEDLIDMLHNLPTLLRGSEEAWFKQWTTQGFYEQFVAHIHRLFL